MSNAYGAGAPGYGGYGGYGVPQSAISSRRPSLHA